MPKFPQDAEFVDPQAVQAFEYIIHDGRLLWELFSKLQSEDVERLATFCWFYRREVGRPLAPRK